MKLAEAAALGAMYGKYGAYDINTCFHGLAGNAIGIPHSEECYQPLPDGTSTPSRAELIIAEFPWLKTQVPSHTYNWFQMIAQMFDSRVCEGLMTFKQLEDYVRSVEPDCGICNEFRCLCVKSETPTETREEVLCQ